MKYLFSAAIAAILMATTACGPSTDELKAARVKAATDRALVDYKEFRSARTGAQAEEACTKIEKDLSAENVTMDEAIHVTSAELRAHQSNLYEQDADIVQKRLHETHGDVLAATRLADECRRLTGKAGDNVSPELAKGLELAVARNMKEQAKKIENAYGIRKKAKARRPATASRRHHRRGATSVGG